MAASFTIDERDEALIDGLVESGRYKSASDVVRAGPLSIPFWISARNSTSFAS